MVTHKLIPVWGCFYASGRSKWIMWFQTVPLQFSERGFYSRGTELVCSLRVTELFFPFFVTRLLKIIVYSILLHCFSHFTFLWFVSPIVNLKLLFFHMNFDGFHMKYYFTFKVTAAFSWKVQGLFQLFPNWNVSYVYFCLTHGPALCFSISWEMWWCRGKEEEWANMSWE